MNTTLNTRTSIKLKKGECLLALGAESAGVFSVLSGGVQADINAIFISKNFGDLLDEQNFIKFKKAILRHLKTQNLKPKVILTDLHPRYNTTLWGKELAKKFSAGHIQVQHHLAHIFSAIGADTARLKTGNYELPAVIGIACDGTGYGLDGKIWGGEIFKLQTVNHKLKTDRIGHLENQILIGGDLAIREPARMVVSILAKFLPKEEIYPFVKKYYNKNKFNLLYNQLQQNFNCQETSSTGRILDAVSVLLGFSGNDRENKHAPIAKLEKNSGEPYLNLKPKIKKTADGYSLLTTPLFAYLIKNLHKDKQRLAATAQLYIARSLYEIVKSATADKLKTIYFAGGMANNKIMSNYLKSKGAYINNKIPSGDPGLSFGQIVYCLFMDVLVS